MMVSQTKIVLEILSGKDSGWSAQNRDGRTNWKTAFNRYIGHTILGIATTLLVYFQLNSLFYWILPITIGLMLSIPLASLSSYESIGLGLLKRKWFVIPEEIHAPQVANQAKRIYATLKKDKKSNGVLDLITNNYLLEIHTYMLKTNGPIPEFSKSIQNEARIKLHNFIYYGRIPQLTPDEEFSILYDADVLHEANLLHYLYK